MEDTMVRNPFCAPETSKEIETELKHALAKRGAFRIRTDVHAGRAPAETGAETGVETGVETGAETGAEAG
jgi:hypothetical protein